MLQVFMKNKKENLSIDPITISLEEKEFYIALYNKLPVNFSLAFHSDIINLNYLILNNPVSFLKGSAFLEKYSNYSLDFLVLDNNLQSCAVVLFDYPKDSRTYTDFYKGLIELKIPVFVYEKADNYNFQELLFFIHNNK
jgi:hypothetical protein